MNAAIALVHRCSEHDSSIVFTSQPFHDWQPSASQSTSQFTRRFPRHAASASQPPPSLLEHLKQRKSYSCPVSPTSPSLLSLPATGAEGGSVRPEFQRRALSSPALLISLPDDSSVVCADRGDETSTCTSCNPVYPLLPREIRAADVKGFVHLEPGNDDEPAENVCYIGCKTPKHGKLCTALQVACYRSFHGENVPGFEGPVLFGDDIYGYAISYIFTVNDIHAHNGRRFFSFVVLMADRLYLVASWVFLVDKLRSLANDLQRCADRVDLANQERRDKNGVQRQLREYYLKRQPGTPLRSLVELTGLPDLFSLLHASFSWILRACARHLKEIEGTVNTTPQEQAKIRSRSISEASSPSTETQSSSPISSELPTFQTLPLNGAPLTVLADSPSTPSDQNLENADPNKQNLENADPNNPNFENADPNKQNLEDADLSKPNFEDADPNIPNFENADSNKRNLENADANKPTLEDANPNKSNFENADLNKPFPDSSSVHSSECSSQYYNPVTVDLADLERCLGYAEFRKLVWNVVIGNQVIAKGPERRLIILLLKSLKELLPENMIREVEHSESYHESWICNFLGLKENVEIPAHVDRTQIIIVEVNYHKTSGTPRYSLKHGVDPPSTNIIPPPFYASTPAQKKLQRQMAHFAVSTLDSSSDTIGNSKFSTGEIKDRVLLVDQILRIISFGGNTRLTYVRLGVLRRVWMGHAQQLYRLVLSGCGENQEKRNTLMSVLKVHENDLTVLRFWMGGVRKRLRPLAGRFGTTVAQVTEG